MTHSNKVDLQKDGVKSDSTLVVDHETLRGWLRKAGLYNDGANASGIAVVGNDAHALVSWCNWIR